MVTKAIRWFEQYTWKHIMLLQIVEAQAHFLPCVGISFTNDKATGIWKSDHQFEQTLVRYQRIIQLLIEFIKLVVNGPAIGFIF